MFDLAQLYALLADQYGLRNMTLSPIHHVAQAGRGIFHVAVPGHADLLLRAYQQPRTLVPQLDNSAAVLCFLGECDFPAPRVQRTVVGETVGEAYGWSTLLLSYIEGEAATGTVAEFQQLGRVLAQLHSVDGATATAAQPALPPCRWQPWQKVIGWYTNLAQVADDVPTELAALCQFSLNILAQVGQWSAMPNTLLHGDPNHVNAVCTGIADRTAPNSLVLIDWDNAGLGPPILDLGYLLLTAHAALPAWPQIDANDALIAASMAGYCAVRPLTAAEGQALPIATCLNDAVWAAQALPQVIGRDWRENRTLTRFGARYPSLAQIGRLAQQYGG